MRIAVTYEEGNIFQHFGRTESFKVYEIEDNTIISSEVIGSDGVGHGALAGLLDDKSIEVLICGGIGGGAQNALASVGIEVCSGAEGNADEAVEAFLKGELVSAGTTCDHHGEGHSCGHHEDGEGCGHGGCGHHQEEEGCGHGCGGGCHRMQPIMEGKNVMKTCKVHYTGTFNDGEKFDSSYDRGEPLEFVCGVGMMIQGFDKAVANMEAGEIRDIHLMPEEAYGPSNPEAIFTFDISEMPGAENLEAGQKVYLQDQFGQAIPVIVVAREGDSITLDANHEMAGKELNFKIELVEVSA